MQQVNINKYSHMKNTINKIKNSKFWSKFNYWIVVIIIVELALTGWELFKETMNLKIAAIAAMSVVICFMLVGKVVLFALWNSNKPASTITKKEKLLILFDFTPRLYIVTLVLCKQLISSLIIIELIRVIAYMFAVIPAFNIRSISENKKKLFVVLALTTSILELITIT